jgi:putative aldouronate transport system permease protein
MAKRTIKGTTVRLNLGDQLFYTLIEIFLVVMLVVVAIPMWSTITLSFRSNTFVGSNLEGMFLPPWKWSTAAYKALLGNSGFLNALVNSLKIFVMGVTCALFFTIPLAYALSIKTLPGRKIFNIFILIPYLFNVGLIPSYLVVIKLGFTNKLASVFFPMAISTYNCIIMRGFFEGIPEELKESARIDGASEIRVLLRIIIPLSKPILMTIGLYYGVSFWNDFFHAMLYINNNSLNPLPILLRNILMSNGMNEFLEVNAFGEAPIQAIKAASVFMAAIPMLIVYPFIQKYFTRGTLLGSVKG